MATLLEQLMEAKKRLGVPVNTTSFQSSYIPTRPSNPTLSGAEAVIDRNIPISATTTNPVNTTSFQSSYIPLNSSNINLSGQEAVTSLNTDTPLRQVINPVVAPVVNPAGVANAQTLAQVIQNAIFNKTKELDTLTSTGTITQGSGETTNTGTSSGTGTQGDGTEPPPLDVIDPAVDTILDDLWSQYQASIKNVGNAFDTYTTGLQNQYQDYNKQVLPLQDQYGQISNLIASQTGDTSKVIDDLKLGLAQRLGNFEDLNNQVNEATVNAYQNYPELVNQLKEQFRTTEGYIDPAVLASAEQARKPAMVSALNLDDLRNTLLGQYGTDVQSGLDAYNAQIKANQLRQQANLQQQQALLGNLSTWQDINKTIPELAQTKASLASNQISNYGNVLTNQSNAMQLQDLKNQLANPTATSTQDTGTTGDIWNKIAKISWNTDAVLQGGEPLLDPRYDYIYDTKTGEYTKKKIEGISGFSSLIQDSTKNQQALASAKQILDENNRKIDVLKTFAKGLPTLNQGQITDQINSLSEINKQQQDIMKATDFVANKSRINVLEKKLDSNTITDIERQELVDLLSGYGVNLTASPTAQQNLINQVKDYYPKTAVSGAQNRAYTQSKAQVKAEEKALEKSDAIYASMIKTLDPKWNKVITKNTALEAIKNESYKKSEQDKHDLAVKKAKTELDTAVNDFVLTRNTQLELYPDYADPVNVKYRLE